MAEEVVHVIPDEVGDAQAQPTRTAMRWTSVMSGFVLRHMCQLISTGVRTDKGFKEVHLNHVAKHLHEFTGNDVTGTQVYNHLRKWRQRWVRVSKLRELSGANWDDDVSMITLEEEHYKGHIKAHPKDAELLNKPIENYKEMLTIFGIGLATGKYAMGSNETLGSPADCGATFIKTEQDDGERGTQPIDDVHKLWGEATKEAKEGTTAVPPGSNKRKRGVLSDDDVSVMHGMTDAVKEVDAAIRDTKVQIIHPDLYGAVMYMPGFPDEALIVAYSHLLDNKAQGDAFVGMTEAHRVLWLRTWLAKHYYM